MLVAGFETENLIILAGETSSFNQFELRALVDKVLAELNLNWQDREKILKNYICYLFAEIINGSRKMSVALAAVKDIYIELGYDPSFYEFYLLYYAWADLQFSEAQFYWPGATRKNINGIVFDYLKNWKAKCG